MTAQEIYTALDELGIDYEVIQIFEGARFIRVEVEEEDEEVEEEVEGEEEEDETPKKVVRVPKIKRGAKKVPLWFNVQELEKESYEV